MLLLWQRSWRERLRLGVQGGGLALGLEETRAGVSWSGGLGRVPEGRPEVPGGLSVSQQTLVK